MAMPRPGSSLEHLLIEHGLVSPEQLEKVIRESGISDSENGTDYNSTSTKLGNLLVKQSIITAQNLAMITGLQLSIPSIKLSSFQIQPEVLRVIPESMARKYNVIPLAISSNALEVAMADPGDVLILEAMAARARMRIEPSIAPVDEIREAIDRNYKSYGEIAEQLTHIAETTEEETTVDTVAEAPVVRALDLIVNEAIKNRASDIHIEPQEDKLRVRYRIDGVLHDTMSLPLSAHAPLISRLKILASMNIADHRPQDGQFSVNLREQDADIRVATINTTYGEMAVLRVLDKSFSALSLTDLGFSPDNLDHYDKMLKTPFGMVLICGPTGSGKTTTLYASINRLDSKERKIITVEDPVEYHFRDINQIQINSRAGLTFATSLRAIMRHDPDVILIGEIRDSETAEIAIQASLTGHLVLCSVHANDTIGSIFRLIDLGIGPFLISSALIGVVSQRMVRKVCPYCRQLLSVPKEAQLGYAEEMGEERTEFLVGTGCNACADTGYLGRTAVFEIFNMSEEIKRMLLTGASASQMRDQAKEEGMISMWRGGMIKVKAGITTPTEVIRSIHSLG